MINRTNVIGMIWLMNLSNSWRLHFTLGSVLLLFYCYKPFFLLALAHGNAERGESLGGLGFTTIRQAFACLSRKLSIPNNLLGSIFCFLPMGCQVPPAAPPHTTIWPWCAPLVAASRGGALWGHDLGAIGAPHHLLVGWGHQQWPGEAAL